MNSPTEISASTQLLLDEIRKIFDKFDARWAKWDGVREASQAISVPTQAVAVDVDIIADNWGGCFSGGVVSSKPQCAEPSITADNWDGLFDQPAPILEESFTIDSVDATFVMAAVPFSTLPVTTPPSHSIGLICALPLREERGEYIDAIREEFFDGGLTDPLEISLGNDSALQHQELSITICSLPAYSLASSSEDTDRTDSWPGDSCDLRSRPVATLALPASRLADMLPDVLPNYLHALCFSGNEISGGVPVSFVTHKSFVLFNLPHTMCSMQVCNSTAGVKFSSNIIDAQDKVPHNQLWPPPEQCEIQGDDVQMVVGVPAVLQLRPCPWPSFHYTAYVQFEIQSNGGHLRPTPWPSFIYNIISRHLQRSLSLVPRPSVNMGFVRSIHCEFSLRCWNLEGLRQAPRKCSSGEVVCKDAGSGFVPVISELHLVFL